MLKTLGVFMGSLALGGVIFTQYFQQDGTTGFFETGSSVERTPFVNQCIAMVDELTESDLVQEKLKNPVLKSRFNTQIRHVPKICSCIEDRVSDGLEDPAARVVRFMTLAEMKVSFSKAIMNKQERKALRASIRDEVDEMLYSEGFTRQEAAEAYVGTTQKALRCIYK